MRWAAPMLVSVILLSGCLGETSPGGGTGDAPAEEAGPRVETFEQEGTLRASWAQAGGLGDAEALTFPVGKGAQRIVATLTWEGAGTDLDLVLTSPKWCAEHGGPVDELACSGRSKLTGQADASEGWFHNRNGTVATPDNPSRITLERDAIEAHSACAASFCNWHARVYAKPAAEAHYTIQVDVQY